jgi:hypothetical protein
MVRCLLALSRDRPSSRGIDSFGKYSDQLKGAFGGSVGVRVATWIVPPFDDVRPIPAAVLAIVKLMALGKSIAGFAGGALTKSGRPGLSLLETLEALSGRAPSAECHARRLATLAT